MSGAGAAGAAVDWSGPLVVERADDLDAAACLDVVAGRPLRLGDDLLAAVSARRALVLEHLAGDTAVYGVTTGMGAASTIRLDEHAQAAQQENLMLARAVGSPPWLPVAAVRAAVVVRLRTFLNLDAGVSAALCGALVDLLNGHVHPAVPATGLGAAGEIIPLAHLGGALTGVGSVLDPSGSAVPAPRRLELGPKEGVALIEGVPVTTGLALLRAQDARALVAQVATTLGASLKMIGASRDPFRASVARGDDVLASVLEEVRAAWGAESAATALQAPLSFRVAGPASAALLRAAGALDAAAGRALVGVTDSPAFLADGETGSGSGSDSYAFVGTAGFDGFELAAACDALRVAVVHVAELSAARIHRLLDDRVTGLPRQLSDRPGLHAGAVVVHKRAVGVVHALVRQSAPASLGAVETSLGQEDSQSFSLEAAAALGVALDGLREVLACELVVLTQARRLAGAGGVAGAGGASAGGAAAGAGAAAAAAAAAPDSLLARVDALVAPGTADRPLGSSIAAVQELLAAVAGR